MKRNRRIPKKLSLKTEVVRYLKPLDPSQLHQVDGALQPTPLMYTGPDCSKNTRCTASA
jgi:hypothetical protein